MNKKFNKSNALSRNYAGSGRLRSGGRRTSPRPTSPVVKKYIQPLYTRFTSDDVITNAKADIITAGMWSGNDGELQGGTELFTSSIQQAASKEYYTEFYRENPDTDSSAEPQFAIAYGNVHGSGSSPVSEYSSDGFTPTKAIYNQYRNLCLAPGDDFFSHGTGNDYTASIFVNVNRNRYKERIDPGNWELKLYHATIFGGSAATFTFVDSSIQEAGALGEAGAVYDVWSGSIANGRSGATTYGKFYPDMGVIALFPKELGMVQDLNYCWCTTSPPYTSNGGVQTTQHMAALTTAFKDANASFAARSAEKVYTTHYFIRLKNAEYNFSNNPTFTTGSQGVFAHASMYKDPKVYITTVGMYNDKNELLAIAKLSKPLLKSFTREALIRVKLEF